MQTPSKNEQNQKTKKLKNMPRTVKDPNGDLEADGTHSFGPPTPSPEKKKKKKKTRNLTGVGGPTLDLRLVLRNIRLEKQQAAEHT